MIPRDFFESGYWRQSRTYNDCEALLDIIQQVRFEASEQFARIGGREVTWGQAEWPASVRFLAGRWNWTERRVRTFLASLKRNGIITTDDSQGVNIIKLVKYTNNEIGDTTNDTTNDTVFGLSFSQLQELVTQQVTQCLTQQRHSSDTKHNNGNNNKKDSSLRSESKEEYDWSLLSDEMRPVVERWLAYKQEKRQAYKPIGFVSFCKELIKLSGNDAEKASLIIEQSMSRNYSGIFELKHGYESTTTGRSNYQPAGSPSNNEMVAGAAGLISELAQKRRNSR